MYQVRPDGRQSGAVRAAVLHVVLHFRQSYSAFSVPCWKRPRQAITLRILQKYPAAVPGAMPRVCKAFRRSRSVVIIASVISDTESYPQFQQSFQQALTDCYFRVFSTRSAIFKILYPYFFTSESADFVYITLIIMCLHEVGAHRLSDMQTGLRVQLPSGGVPRQILIISLAADHGGVVTAER